jgi:uncharacterized protein (TIGR02996 family)
MSMPLDAAFLEDIRAHPEDDTPRLIYADWLEDHDQPERAEFIRLQCERECLPDDDERQEMLPEREWQLLDAHEQTWAAPLRGMVERWQFRRGFIEWVEMTADAFLEHAQPLFHLAPIRQVRLTRAGGRLFSLASSHWLRNLTALYLWGNHIRAEGAMTLASCPHLVNLTTLDLTDNRIGDEGAAALAASPHLTNLTALVLSENRIGDAGATALGASRSLANLTTLHLSHNNIRSEGAAALVSSAYLSNLIALFLDNNDIGDERAAAWASPSLANLVYLVLSRNHIGPEGASVLASSPYLSNLAALDLNFNHLGEEGKAALTARFAPRLLV